MNLIDVEKIVLDPELNIRDGGVSDRTAAEYAEAMRDGAQFPPVAVFCDPYMPDVYLLSDGFHRVEAACRNGWKQIEADVRCGTRRDAWNYALQANLRHGKPLTLAERKRATVEFLKLHPDWSNNRVEKAMGVNRMTVERIRQEAEDEGVLPRMAELVGDDGKVYPRYYKAGADDPSPTPQYDGLEDDSIEPVRSGDSGGRKEMATGTSRRHPSPLRRLYGKMKKTRPMTWGYIGQKRSQTRPFHCLMSRQMACMYRG